MNQKSRNFPQANGFSSTKFEYDYTEALNLYKRYKNLCNADKKSQESSNFVSGTLELSNLDMGRSGLGAEVVIETHRAACIEKLKKCIYSWNSNSHREERLYVLMLLVQLLGGNTFEHAQKENYFFLAVEWLWINNLSDPILGKMIVDTYVREMHIEFKWADVVNRPEYIDLMLHKIIKFEFERNRQKRLLITESIEAFIQSNPTSNEIVSKIKDVGWFWRFFIVSDDCHEILRSEWFTNLGHEVHWKEDYQRRQVELNIFDRPRKYSIYMDRAKSDIPTNLLDLDWNINLLPLVELLISHDELEHLNRGIEAGRLLEERERNKKNISNKNDYRDFIARVLARYWWSISDSPSDVDANTVDIYVKAIDLCRILLHTTQDSKVRQDALLQKIDSILWRKIQRKILQTAKIMMMSHNEGMNGFGYPFSLSKDNIPLAGKIFSIIRQFEGWWDRAFDATQKNFIGGGWDYFIYGNYDSDIYAVFSECLVDWVIPKRPSVTFSRHKVTRYRKEIYIRYINQFNWLKWLKWEIRDKLFSARQISTKKESKNILFREVNELKTTLLKEADMRKIIIITRHGETESDLVSGVPWMSWEMLTDAGKISSKKKWEILQDLQLKVFTSPLLRASRTSEIICEQVKSRVSNLTIKNYAESRVDEIRIDVWVRPCAANRGIIAEPSLANPPKDIENDRYDSLLQKFLSDTNTREIWEFVKNMLFWLEETMNLCITHRDTARHLIIWLNNVFSKNSISGYKVEVGNDTIYEVCFRWGGIMQVSTPDSSNSRVENWHFQLSASWWKDEPCRGFIFWIKNWQRLLHLLNTISERVYSRPFFTNDYKLVNLIELNDELLDFIDYESEQNPDAFALFVEHVTWQPELASLAAFLNSRMKLLTQK